MLNPREQDATLTEGQRRFLQTGGRGISSPAQSQHRSGIRDRLPHAIQDFSLVFDELPADEQEELFEDFDIGDDMAQGIVDFIALVYYHTHLGGQFKNLLWRGVSKAERELAGDDSYLVRVDFEVEPVPEVNFERALEKFDRRKMGDMTAGEAQAIVHLLRRSSSISHADLEEAREEMAEWAEEAAEDQQNASRESTISKREQQADRLEDPEE